MKGIKYAGTAGLCCLVMARGGLAQIPRPYVPPHYPVPTEKLQAVLPHTTVNPVELTGTPLMSSVAIGRASKMIVQGQRLWVGDQMGDPFLHVVDIPSGGLRKSFARNGEGPGDFHSATQLSLRPGDTSGVWVFDYNLRRMTRVTERPDPRHPPTVITALGRGVAHRMLWFGKDRVLFISQADTDRVMLADSLGRVIATVRGPLLGSSDIPMNTRAEDSNGMVCARPDGSAFAIAYLNASRIDLFDAKGGLRGHANVPVPNVNEGDFYKDPRGVWHTPKPRRYYNECFATQNLLYTLFAGRLATAGPEGTHPWDAQFIHVFDWNGNLLAAYKLDQLAETFAVSGDSLLFAGGEAIEGIYRYSLPVLRPPKRP